MENIVIVIHVAAADVETRGCRSRDKQMTVTLSRLQIDNPAASTRLWFFHVNEDLSSGIRQAANGKTCFDRLGCGNRRYTQVHQRYCGKPATLTIISPFKKQKFSED